MTKRLPNCWDCQYWNWDANDPDPMGAPESCTKRHNPRWFFRDEYDYGFRKNCGEFTQIREGDDDA